MKKLLGIFLIFCSYFALSQKKIVVLGSSTSAGFGATTYDSSWVGRLQQEFEKNKMDGLDTIIINLGHGGFTSYKVMPTGFVSTVPNRPAPSNDSNITKALSFNPDIIIINLPTNDIASDFSEAEVMNNFRYLLQVIASHGIRYFITTSQPRNDLDSTHRLQLRQLTDSINSNFNLHVLNFWDDLVTSDGSFKFRPELTPDGIHPDDLAHKCLFQRVKAKSIFTSDTSFSQVTVHTEAENYLTMSGVGTETTTDTGGGRDVNYIDPSDWMDYNIYVASAGNYKINLRVATPGNNAELQIKKADGSLLENVKLPHTGGFQLWQTVSAFINLSQGRQSIRLVSTSPQWNNWNINWFDIQSVNSIPAPVPPPVSYNPDHIEAENYTNMYGVATEPTADTGGGLNVSYIDPGDWMEYNINVPSAGSYKISLRVASPASNAQLQLEKSDGSLLGTVNLPKTGGYQLWQTAFANINLVQGAQTIRIISTSPQWNNWNFNWLELSYTGNVSSIVGSPVALKNFDEASTGNQLSIHKITVTPGKLNTEILTSTDKVGEISIYNNSGFLISREQHLFSHPVSTITTGLGSLPPGVYILVVTAASGRSSKQFALLK